MPDATHGTCDTNVRLKPDATYDTYDAYDAGDAYDADEDAEVVTGSARGLAASSRPRRKFPRLRFGSVSF